MALDIQTFKKLSIPLEIPQTLEMDDMRDLLDNQLEGQKAAILDYLLDKNLYNVNEPWGYPHDTLLHVAVEHNSSIECVKILVKHGADVFLKNRSYRTPYDLIKNKESDIARYLKNVMDEKKAEAKEGRL